MNETNEQTDYPLQFLYKKITQSLAEFIKIKLMMLFLILMTETNYF